MYIFRTVVILGEIPLVSRNSNLWINLGISQFICRRKSSAFPSFYMCSFLKPRTSVFKKYTPFVSDFKSTLTRFAKTSYHGGGFGLCTCSLISRSGIPILTQSQPELILTKKTGHFGPLEIASYFIAVCF